MKLLNVLTIEQINEHINNALCTIRRCKTIDVKNANHYVLASDVYATESVPQFRKSKVDGYALSAKMTSGASAAMPIILKKVETIPIGTINTYQLQERYCQYLNTGAMVPDNATAIVMIEQTEKMLDDVLIYHAAAQNENIISIGQDVEKGSLLLKKGDRLDERKLALLMSAGVTSIEVYDQLTCVIISSGNELIEYDQPIECGQVRDVNTILVKKAMEAIGVKIVATYLIKDDLDLYYDCLNRHDADLYITSGGSSKGSEDYTYDVLEKICGKVVCHGLAIKPGKPTLLAYNNKSIYLGLPGNPVSAYIVLLQTLVKVLQEIQHIIRPSIQALVSHNINASGGKATVILVSLKESNNQVIATPIYFQSSHLHSLAQADGYFVIGANSEGVNKMDVVEVIRL